MRLVRYDKGGKPTLGVLDSEGQGVVDVTPVADDMGSLIRAWSPAVAERLSQAAAAGHGTPLDKVRLLAPCAPAHRNIFCVGKNYLEHAAEFERSGYDSGASVAGGGATYPVIFTKATTSVIGPDDGIPDHADLTQALDYEAELAVVIGLGGRSISKANAWDHVLGYTVLNDVTARDLQRNHQQWFLGKSLDGFCPMGPYLVTRDEVDAAALEVRSWVNGELRQSANTADLIFDIPTLIATISAGITLEPGDVLATGTPSGVGAGFDPPRFLKAGDLVTIEVEGVGHLSNRVIAR
jgi:2-keto-4-pentenoate hydratase/2-oxohepta-3-ene-1,7-dioic acid hydratase in catechol pathway